MMKKIKSVWLVSYDFLFTAVQHQMGPVRIRHNSHDLGWQSSHSVDLPGWQAQMASIEIWIPWRNTHKPHCSKILSLGSGRERKKERECSGVAKQSKGIFVVFFINCWLFVSLSICYWQYCLMCLFYISCVVVFSSFVCQVVMPLFFFCLMRIPSVFIFSVCIFVILVHSPCLVIKRNTGQRWQGKSIIANLRPQCIPPRTSFSKLELLHILLDLLQHKYTERRERLFTGKKSWIWNIFLWIDRYREECNILVSWMNACAKVMLIWYVQVVGFTRVKLSLFCYLCFMQKPMSVIVMVLCGWIGSSKWEVALDDVTWKLAKLGELRRGAIA